MAKLVRFGVSLEKSLLDKFDKLIRRKKYPNRSEAFRDLIRQELVKQEWGEGKEVAGAVTIIYDHHKRELLNKITHIQHDFLGLIVSAQHVHLDHHNCMEIIVMKGSPKDVQRLANTLKSVKGVKHGALSASSTGREIG